MYPRLTTRIVAMAFSDTGLLQNPVAPNKQVVKLDVHPLLRGGNKAVKLHAIPPAATYKASRIRVYVR